MADTIPDISIDSSVYYDINTLAGVAVGTGVALANKGNGAFYLQVSTSQPSATSTDGAPVYAREQIAVEAGESTVWVRAAQNPTTVSVDIS